eukprot:CAMPEP_0184313090 /NCGR_PEP_ID=MMETSP1049-20130417/58980_1 /TAXON_ID=77928 /ORGANISM="Proteomonas sulcata, Strain CCMP704" /LENGTH=117 /DNA_ID=CAMNT_0026629959 /DNA_START=34 /DNA_END=388 /DNA_ORIENTATION=-
MTETDCAPSTAKTRCPASVATWGLDSKQIPAVLAELFEIGDLDVVMVGAFHPVGAMRSFAHSEQGFAMIDTDDIILRAVDDQDWAIDLGDLLHIHKGIKSGVLDIIRYPYTRGESTL